MSDRISVVLADDTPDIRLLTRLTLESAGGFDVVGEAGDGEAAVQVTTDCQPDVLLLDLAMPVLDGLQAIPMVRAAAPDTRIVVVSGFESATLGPEAARLGAHAYVQKGRPARQLVETIREVCGKPAPPGADTRQRLRSAQADFVATAAHELRNPIAAVLGSAEILQARWESLDPGDRQLLLDAIARQSRHMRRLVDDLLTAARVEAGQLSLDPVVLEVPEAIAAALEVVGDDGEFDVVCPAGVTAWADPHRFEQVLTNYVTNARKYGRPPFVITVTRAEDGVELRVRDHGDGVDPADAPHLFERWSKAASGKREGVGLGLFIVRRIARAMGGDAWFEAPDGAGACFALRLPAPPVA